MNDTMKTHVCQLPQRTARVTVEELPDKVRFRLRLTRYGDFGDEAEFRAWLGRIMAPYDSDPRPLEMDNPHSGSVATVFGDAGSSFVVVHKPASHAAGAQRL